MGIKNLIIHAIFWTNTDISILIQPLKVELVTNFNEYHYRLVQ